MKPPFDPSMSDGCSVPESIRHIIHTIDEQCARCRPACVIHDEAYYYGGTEDQRRAADEALYVAIRPIIGEQWAIEWYNAVRYFGGSHWGTGRTWNGRALWSAPTEAP